MSIARRIIVFHNILGKIIRIQPIIWNRLYLKDDITFKENEFKHLIMIREN